ncbi:Ig-like domain-containing protein [Gottfriedia acidiceleris]|uniref:Ig-like domain-containing protein n=1 Tax=Gottfriedia acidiceleris TaxID=371036 RepID=UPI00101D59A3|nr:Ig-like domain-containing protein [Gottfriedia acidiceleris]
MIKKTSLSLLCILLFFGTITSLSQQKVVLAATEPNSSLIFASPGNTPILSPDGKRVFVNFGMYDTETGALLNHVPVRYLNFSPNGSYLYSNEGENLTFFNVTTGDELFTLPYHIAQLSFKGSDERIMGITHELSDGTYGLTIYDDTTKSVLFEKTFDYKYGLRVSIHPTEPIVAVTDDSTIEIINYETKKVIKTIENPFKTTRYYPIRQMIFSPDGNTLSLTNDSGIANPFVQYNVHQNFEKSSTVFNVYINESSKTNKTTSRTISYGKNNELIFHYIHKIKFFNATTGAYLRTVGSDIDQVVFSQNMDKIAYTKNTNDTNYEDPEFIEVQGYPMIQPATKRIEFKDPYIQLKENQSTYYGLQYVNEKNELSFLDPNEITLTPIDSSIVSIDASHKLIANKAGSTIIKATYQGLVDYLSVNVVPEPESRIKVNSLYDSSLTITGTAPPNIKLSINAANYPYEVMTKPDGTFTVPLTTPLRANTTVHFMYFLEDLFPAEAPPGTDTVVENVLRDTVAPKPPVIMSIDNATNVVKGTAEPNATINLSTNLLSPITASRSSALSIDSMVSAKTASTMSTAVPLTSQLTTGNTVTTKANKYGQFTVTLKNVAQNKTIQSTATDLVGNRSKVTVSKIKDTIAPNAPSVNRISNISTTVSGKSEANAMITIKKGTIVLKTGKATSTGAFSIAILKQLSGTTLSITATDASKNTSKSTTVKVVTAPKTPTVNKVSINSTTITGKSEPTTTVYVKSGSKLIGSAVTSSKGTYSVKIPKQKLGTKLSINARNRSGITSYTVHTTVQK